ncbi:NAD(P)-dependent oxidoreductase [Microbacterium murale]|uniref:Phosphoglycerate dehydrogenase-like enzyme n=1 Tax=Microbacterium murale TaxID=1081040 RepID=A0ABU0P5M2_9MICO|nr:NAD(P)-dependent oxidoreductase [Microbacterium murale]MDQ0642610.1 phosphoglycerate dehydrogenase-like enzyme [Microbacterium murale]
MTYRVGITNDAIDEDGTSVHGDLVLPELEAAGIEWSVIDAHPETDDDLADLDAVYSLGHRGFDASVLAAAPRLRHIARFGAGYDTIDLEACSDAGVIVTNTPDAIRRPLALAALTLVLAVTHNLVQKHAIVVHDRWEDRGRWRGTATDGSTVAIVGFGSVGAELAGMLLGAGFRVIGVNRRGSSAEADRLGVPIVPLDEGLTADVVVLCASLNASTTGMIGAAELAKMKPSAAIVNVGRGALIDQGALTSALQDGTIRAAGLDVFDPEPPAPDDPLLALENVTLAPHALCWTADYTRAVVASANEAIITASRGGVPATVLNPRALEHERWREGAAVSVAGR